VSPRVKTFAIALAWALGVIASILSIASLGRLPGLLVAAGVVGVAWLVSGRIHKTEPTPPMDLALAVGGSIAIVVAVIVAAAVVDGSTDEAASTSTMTVIRTATAEEPQAGAEPLIERDPDRGTSDIFAGESGEFFDGSLTVAIGEIASGFEEGSVARRFTVAAPGDVRCVFDRLRVGDTVRASGPQGAYEVDLRALGAVIASVATRKLNSSSAQPRCLLLTPSSS
jgi:hypothetical protein